MSRSSSGTGRQSILPLRVQEANRQCLTTPQNKERPGFGKLGLTRPSSIKSDRSSTFGKRLTSGTPRNSQYGAFGGSDKIKEPRPLHDKAYVQQCIRQLCEFLSENGYSQNISVKSLQAPSSKDFVRIFSFIYSCIAPGYEAPLAKFEEEIPRIFKDLGYPFPLSKSSMYTVGAPHTWPQIVGALVWLTECVKLYFHLKDSQIVHESWGEETEDGIEHNKVFLDFNLKCYTSFMEGGDSYDEYDREVCSKLREFYKVSDSQLEGLHEENRNLAEVLESLEREKDTEPDRLSAMRKQKAILSKDIHAFENYLTGVRAHTANLEQKTLSISADVEAAKLESEALRAEAERVKNILDTQQYSVADIERIQCEQVGLQQTINMHSKELEEERKQMWNEELQYAKIKEQIEALIIEYHNLARQLKLIPSSADNAFGNDFQISFTPESSETCLSECRTRIIAPLMKLMNVTEEEITKANNRKASLEEMYEQVNSMVTEKTQDVKVLTDELQKLEEMFEQKLKASEVEQQEMVDEMKSLEQHKQHLETALNKGIGEAQKTYEEAQKQLQLAEQQTTDEGRQLWHKLNRITEAIMGHMEAIEKYLDDQHSKVSKDFEELQKKDLLKEFREGAIKYKTMMAESLGIEQA